MRNSHRVGFTLIELIVAISIGAVVLLIARALVDALGEHVEHSAAAARHEDADANGERLLRNVMANVQVGDENHATLDGDAVSVDLLSWCQSARGWMERCSVSISLEPDGQGLALLASLSSAKRVVVWRANRSIELRYLADATAGGTWRTEWHQKFATPRAIALVSDGDTTIIRIGERG
jgi:prepilin-type N-terminal cleavage/methylation domain-containing protein